MTQGSRAGAQAIGGREPYAAHAMLAPEADGYGRLIYDHHRGLRSAEVIERDDGRFDWKGSH